MQNFSKGMHSPSYYIPGRWRDLWIDTKHSLIKSRLYFTLSVIPSSICNDDLPLVADIVFKVLLLKYQKIKYKDILNLLVF